MRLIGALFALVTAFVTTTVADAHFKLIEPASWIVENERGDPQKAAPCGADAKAEMSKAVTPVKGGSMLHLKVVETIYHPGHYRVALAVNSREELPPDPMTFERTTEKGPRSTRPASPQTYEADVRLPNITCAKCILQVIQFMADHAYNQPGGYSYHHCAELKDTADTEKPTEKGWPTVTTAQ
jgi:Lytic polysaccharide mono-oxygenase, cellulose-degrading